MRLSAEQDWKKNQKKESHQRWCPDCGRLLLSAEREPTNEQILLARARHRCKDLNKADFERELR